MKEKFGEAWERLFAPAVAHRGLWVPEGPPENSLGAFQAACADGLQYLRRYQWGPATASQIKNLTFAQYMLTSNPKHYPGL